MYVLNSSVKKKTNNIKLLTITINHVMEIFNYACTLHFNL